MSASSASTLGFVHHFVAAETGAPPGALVLLHGTGGNEMDLLPLGRALSPGAALLSPRGKVLENGMPRFFRRIAEGVFDEKDLIAQTHELAEFIQHAATHYALDPAWLIAVGYSNGANIAASTMFLHPGLFRAAVLFRPMVPFDPVPKLRVATPPTHTPVFISAGRMDPIIPTANTERLAELLQANGAAVTVHYQLAGHGLAPGELALAQQWLTDTLRTLHAREDSTAT